MITAAQESTYPGETLANIETLAALTIALGSVHYARKVFYGLTINDPHALVVAFQHLRG
jgi:hypothetical protein